MMKAKTTTAFDALNPAAAARRHVRHARADKDKGISAGPLLILAGAGTGKTNTLAHRTAHLVLNGVDPARILMLTFTRRAAQEMIRRTPEHRHRGALRDRGKMGDRSVQSRLAVVRHLPFGGQSDPAPVREASGSGPDLHRARPRRCGRSHGCDPPRAGILEQGQALSAQGHLPRDLQLPRQHAPVAQTDARGAIPLGAANGSRI